MAIKLSLSAIRSSCAAPQLVGIRILFQITLKSSLPICVCTFFEKLQLYHDMDGQVAKDAAYKSKRLQQLYGHVVVPPALLKLVNGDFTKLQCPPKGQTGIS